jgi:cystathionine beta-lyase/cystathionine gamma-synthase
MTPKRRPATAAVHGGRPPQLPGSPVVPPVHRSVIYEFDTAEQFADVMEDSSRGYLYSRIRNPSTDELAAVMAELEGAEAALCYASGMAAISAGLELLAPPGTVVVAAEQLYGQTFALLRGRRPETRFVDLTDEAAVERALDGAGLLYAETISNPLVRVPDLARLAAAARAAGIRMAVDNTMATPIGCRPLPLGVDLVMHSATKYLNGHSDVLAGIAAGSGELVAELARRQLDTGATLAPDSAWLVRRGIKTLHLRWQRCSENALAIGRFLETDDRVERVLYPGLDSHPDHAVATRLLEGCGGVLAFDARGGRAGAERVMDAVSVCLRATSLGGVDTAISHPASTSHRQLSPDELRAVGLSEATLRLTVGCEDAADLIADLDQALR